MAGAILLRRFQKMCCSFRGRRSTLDVSIVIFRGMRSTFDVSCCVFLYIALAGLRQVATRCKFRGKRGILRNVLKIDGSLARNVSSLWFSCGFAVSTGEAAKPLLFEGFQAGCHVVLRGRRGTL